MISNITLIFVIRSQRNILIGDYYDKIDSGDFESLKSYYSKEMRVGRKEAFQTHALIRLIRLHKLDSAKSFLETIDSPSTKMMSKYIFHLVRNGYGEYAYEVFRNLRVAQIQPSRPAYFEIVKYLYGKLETTKGWIALTEMKSFYPLNKDILEFCYDKMLDRTNKVRFDYSTLEYSASHLIKRLKNAYSNHELMKIEKDIYNNFKGQINEDLCRQWIRSILKCRKVSDAFLFATHFDKRYNLNYSAFSMLAIECSLLGNHEATLNAASYIIKKYDTTHYTDMHSVVLKCIEGEERLQSYWDELPDSCKNKRLIECYEECKQKLANSYCELN